MCTFLLGRKSLAFNEQNDIEANFQSLALPAKYYQIAFSASFVLVFFSFLANDHRIRDNELISIMNACMRICILTLLVLYIYLSLCEDRLLFSLYVRAFKYEIRMSVISRHLLIGFVCVCVIALIQWEQPHGLHIYTTARPLTIISQSAMPFLSSTSTRKTITHKIENVCMFLCGDPHLQYPMTLCQRLLGASSVYALIVVSKLESTPSAEETTAERLFVFGKIDAKLRLQAFCRSKNAMNVQKIFYMKTYGL